jgi:pimeloyl-ACP methyl ester carboxylesterase
MEELTNPRTGVRCAWFAEGQGDPPIIFIHGWTGNTTRWEPTRKLLARNHRTIAYDLRGHGRSEKRADMDFGFGAFVEDLLGFMDALRIPRAVLAGHSMGGMIAQHLALDHPDRVEKLVLVGTAACPAPDAAARRKLAVAAWLFGHFFGVMMSLKERGKDPENFPDISDHSLRPIPAAASRCLLTVAGMDTRARLRNLGMPALVVASETDATVAYPLSKDLAACIPGVRFETVTGCSHHIPIERAEFLAKTMEEFLS